MLCDISETPCRSWSTQSATKTVLHSSAIISAYRYVALNLLVLLVTLSFLRPLDLFERPLSGRLLGHEAEQGIMGSTISRGNRSRSNLSEVITTGPIEHQSHWIGSCQERGQWSLNRARWIEQAPYAAVDRHLLQLVTCPVGSPWPSPTRRPSLAYSAGHRCGPDRM
jgi:hypothetical protein